jgi:hypothetical protein
MRLCLPSDGENVTERRDPRLDEPCTHGFLPEECPVCEGQLRPRPSTRMVYSTEYGKVYHFTADCPALQFGQQSVLERGGTPAPIELVSEDSVKHDKSPCPRCKPGSKHNPR